MQVAVDIVHEVIEVDVVAVGQIVLSRTVFGRHVMAVGANEEVAREPLLKLLTDEDEESLRIKNRIAEGRTNRVSDRWIMLNGPTSGLVHINNDCAALGKQFGYRALAAAKYAG